MGKIVQGGFKLDNRLHYGASNGLTIFNFRFKWRAQVEIHLLSVKCLTAEGLPVIHLFEKKNPDNNVNLL